MRKLDIGVLEMGMRPMRSVRHRNKTFQRIQNQSSDSQPFSPRSRYVGCADVATAGSPDVLSPKHFHQQVAKGDGPEQIRNSYDKQVFRQHRFRLLQSKMLQLGIAGPASHDLALI